MKWGPARMARLGIVTGLASEAAVVQRAVRQLGLHDRVLVACAGPGADRAERTADEVIARGATVLLSFGLAGALQPKIKAGTLVLPRLIAGPEGGAVAVQALLHERLDAVLARFQHRTGLLVSATEVIATAKAKARLAAESGAETVDMETLGIARAALDAGVPFVVLRAVADPASRGIPAAALAGVRPDGQVRPLVVLGAALRRPAQIPEILFLARDNAKAIAALGRAARLAIPLLVFGW